MFMKPLNLLVALLLIPIGWTQASSLSFEAHPYLFAQKGDTLKTRVPVLATHLMGWKSPRRAMLYSLILPGMGQWYSDSKGAAKLYFTIEAGLWSYFLVSKAQEGILRTGYTAFAAGNANTNPSGAPDQYFKDLGQFYSSDSANEWIRRQAREQYPNDRAAQNDYISSRLYTGDRTWYWKSEAAWITYRDQRVRSLEAGHRASYAIGWAIVHHVLSALDAARVASKHNRNLSAAPERWDWKLGMTPTLEPGISLSVGRGF
jgi:hypothetical protein